MKGSIDGGLRKSISFRVRIDTLTRNFGDDGNSIEPIDITRNHAVQSDDSYECILQRASIDS